MLSTLYRYNYIDIKEHLYVVFIFVFVFKAKTYFSRNQILLLWILLVYSSIRVTLFWNNSLIRIIAHIHNSLPLHAYKFISFILYKSQQYLYSSIVNKYYKYIEYITCVRNIFPWKWIYVCGIGALRICACHLYALPKQFSGYLPIPNKMVSHFIALYRFAKFTQGPFWVHIIISTYMQYNISI